MQQQQSRFSCWEKFKEILVFLPLVTCTYVVNFPSCHAAAAAAAVEVLLSFHSTMTAAMIGTEGEDTSKGARQERRHVKRRCSFFFFLWFSIYYFFCLTKGSKWADAALVARASSITQIRGSYFSAASCSTLSLLLCLSASLLCAYPRSLDRRPNDHVSIQPEEQHVQCFSASLTRMCMVHCTGLVQSVCLSVCLSNCLLCHFCSILFYSFSIYLLNW